MATIPEAQSPQELKTEDHHSDFEPLNEYANKYKQQRLFLVGWCEPHWHSSAESTSASPERTFYRIS
jgi:hypothetical protein